MLENTLASKSELYIFSDGAKTGLDIELVHETREYIKTISGFKNVFTTFQDTNLGLAQSVITGIGNMLKTHNSVIVLEDDLITSPFFLQYMNEALDLYENNEEVISIHAYSYPVKDTLPETYFLKGADCWGWATWRRGWALFESNGAKLLNEIEKRNLVTEFNFNDSYNFHKMLIKQVKGLNSSWAVRWYASAFLANKLTLYPGKSLVHNIGNDDSGTHSKNVTIYDNSIHNQPITLSPSLPIIEDTESKNKIVKFLRDNNPNTSLVKLTKHIFKKLFVWV